MFFFIWLRGTLPRLRYDQFMRFGWKVLIPVSLVWILAVAAIRAHQPRRTAIDRSTWLIGIGVAVVLSSCVFFVGRRLRGASRRPTATPTATYEGGFPVAAAAAPAVPSAVPRRRLTLDTGRRRVAAARVE